MMNTKAKTTGRLLSLDALRGFDMFWIIGGRWLLVDFHKGTDWNWLGPVVEQLDHAKWEGFQAWDLIFPLFMFVSGVAMPYAILRKMENGLSQRTLVRKIVKRAIILVLLGFVYNGIFQLKFTDPGVRYASVLGQIGIAYLFAGLIVIYTRNYIYRLVWLVGILSTVAIFQLYIPIPGFGAGNLTLEGCMNGYIDRLLLPGRLHFEYLDPQGILCMVSATGITLMGVLAGGILRNNSLGEYKKVIILSLAGVLGIVLALIIRPHYPVIKNAWTTTFNLEAGGISFLLLAFFYLVIDVWKIRKWAFFFRVIGVNAITIYLVRKMVNISFTSKFFLGGLAELSGDYGSFILSIGFFALGWLLLYYMYKRKIFLRV